MAVNAHVHEDDFRACTSQTYTHTGDFGQHKITSCIRNVSFSGHNAIVPAD